MNEALAKQYADIQRRAVAQQRAIATMEGELTAAARDVEEAEAALVQMGVKARTGDALIKAAAQAVELKEKAAQDLADLAAEQLDASERALSTPVSDEGDAQ